MTKLTHRFDLALLWASSLHREQVRKGTNVPYVSHLLGVAAIVLEDGSDEDQAIAAVLHDAPEDQGGVAVLNEIRARFGDRVADIVAGCTDTFEHPKPPWKPRKVAYVAHLEQTWPEVLRVSGADKLHNARSILGDLREIGDEVWKRFSATKEDTLWYYRAVSEVISRRLPGRLARELARTVAQLEREAASQAPTQLDVDFSFVARNDESRRWLRETVGRLRDEDLRRPLANGWTVSAALAHLAFWDRYVLTRWDEAERAGLSVPPIIGDLHLDLSNAAGLTHWRALDPAVAAQDAIETTEAVDARIARLTREQIEAVLASDRPALLDRSVHRKDHLKEIEATQPGTTTDAPVG